MAESATLLDGLTNSQRDAVTHVDGPLLVLAGPGSGKTRVITHRVAHLIAEGVRPWNILAITFTNKAAEEMRQRVLHMGVARGTTLCTFHSLAARLLREFANEAGLKSTFSIYDDADQKAAMRAALKELHLDSKQFPPGRLLNHVSAFKNRLQTVEEVAEQGGGGYMGDVIAKAYKGYEKQLKQNSALDFDDLLMKLALLLRDQPELRDRLNDRYRYVLVDEYQDTNQCQYQIARGLALNHSNLCVTGDPDQSIYSWRGADIGNILAFEQDYPDAKVVRLEENFRSTPEVLALADEVIKHNAQRKEKRLLATKDAGATPELGEYANEYQEAAGMAEWLAALRRDGMEYRDMAVFYRVNSMSRVLEESLRRAGVPYQIVRGVEFFQRKEIKDMIAYLRFLANDDDQISLRRIINTPTRGIGATTIERLFGAAALAGQPVWEAMRQVEQIASLGAAAKTKVLKFVRLIESLRSQTEGPVEDVMRAVYEQTGLQEALAREKTEDPHENVEELMSSAAQYDAEAADPNLAEYLQQIALVSDSDAYDSEAGCVSLMTLHAAKGLEFSAVRIVGLEEGLLPHARSIDDATALEEERRLLFVGITRAEDRLTLSFAHNRTVNGMTQATIRSSLLRGLSGLATTWDAEPTDTPSRSWQDDTFDAADDYRYEDETTVEFRIGEMVRHSKYGVGRIKEVMPSRENSKVVVQFTGGGRKTLVLKYAKLERMDYAD